MKKLFFGLVAFLLFTGVANAQDASKAYKNAKRALSAYLLNPTENAGKLAEANEEMTVALTGAEEQTMAKVWITASEVYYEMVAAETKALYIPGSEAELSEGIENTAMKAIEAANKALELAEKKYERKDALAKMSEAAQQLNIIGGTYLDGGKYAEAYPMMAGVMDVHNTLVANNTKSFFGTEEDVNRQKYITGFCARMAEEDAAAIGYFKDLYEIEYDEAGVYSSYFQLLAKDKANEAQALEVLEMGKKRYPGNTDLLFAEINYYLKENKLDQLVGKLKQAIEKEPDNVSLYSTLGSVYDNLFQRETKAGNTEAADQNFANAMEYYQQALKIDESNFFTHYSIGALYYNKAAVYTEELIELESDLSREGLKKYNAKKEEVFKFFDDALPYFKKAESLNPNDRDTVIALKEIFARKDDLALAKEFKDRLQKIQNGEDVGNSYF